MSQDFAKQQKINLIFSDDRWDWETGRSTGQFIIKEPDRIFRPPTLDSHICVPSLSNSRYKIISS